MQITKDKVVTFHYSLKDADGQTMESSNDSDPMAYLHGHGHGHGNIIAGLEAAMEGKQANETLSVTLAPKDAYGERVENAIQRVPLKHLHGDKKQLARLKAGDVAHINTEQGARQVIVVKAGKFNVDVDTNHPLAGKTLTFDIEVTDVRDATAEEIAHGHAHGVGGHQH